MKTIFFKACLLVIFMDYSIFAIAQSDSLKLDSLKKVLLIEKEDTNKVNTLLALCYQFFNNDKSDAFFQVNQQALQLAAKLNNEDNEGWIYKTKADYYYVIKSNSVEALNNYYEAIKHFERVGDKQGMANIYEDIGSINSDQDNYTECFKNEFLSLKEFKEIGDTTGIASELTYIGFNYSQENKYRESAAYLSEAQKIYKALGNRSLPIPVIANYETAAILYDKEGLAASSNSNAPIAGKFFTQSMQNYEAALKIADSIKSQFAISEIDLNMGRLDVDTKDYTKAKNVLVKGIELTKKFGNHNNLPDGYKSLATADSALGNYEEAYKNYETYIQYRDSILNVNTQKKSLQVALQYDFDKKQSVAKTEQDKKDADAKRIKNRQYFTIGALGIIVLAILIIALIQFRNNRHKQKANLLLQTEKQKVESTLSELKSTQAQLIQSEKMASLGELTAGIAHEIQNPLNFVNNFSEVNKEMIAELKDEIDKGNYNDAKIIADDIEANEEKINHHGRRADSIVKGMLQHSKQTKGVKEPTDINALCDEYLRLSYHGMRAKDKNFNAEFTTDFDESIGKINIVPQDIGRVLLNLFNNAFYAVNEKSQQLSANNYKPSVSVQTKKLNDKIEIIVSDNGNGIPSNIIEKIFQPFFTTKPTGQGTGLGLSLAYDIITKEHKGSIKADSKEGEGTTFTIELPIKKTI